MSDIGGKIDRSTDLSSPFEDEHELGEMSKFGAWLLLGIDGLELGLGTRELDLASKGLVELGQFGEIFTDGPEALRFLDSGSDLSQLVALSKDDFFCFFVEKANEGSSPWFVDREVELELLLRSSVGVSEDSYVCLEDPGGGFWGGLYGEGAFGRSRETTETDPR
jgi:hypothetical protein